MNGAGAYWPWSGVSRLIASRGCGVPARFEQALAGRQRRGEFLAGEDAHVSCFRMALDFTLPDTAGTPTPLHVDGARAAVVVFTCNHCPYALAWHDRIQAVARDYADRGVRVLQISANDAVKYPHDSLDAMRARVDAGEFAGPYLYDETQEVARAWGAKTTPDVFVTDASGVVYRGAPDADHGDPSLNAGVAARRAGGRARRAAGRARRDQAGRLLDQVALIELLYWDGLPVAPGRAGDAARDPRRRSRSRGRDRLPRRTRLREGFVGSPTIRVDGVDLFPADEPPVADLPDLPAGRRALLPHPGPGRAARGARGRRV